MKDSRGIKPVVVIKIGRMVHKTPQKAALAIADIVVRPFWQKVCERASRQGRVPRIDYWTARNKAYNRIFPHCKWLYERK